MSVFSKIYHLRTLLTAALLLPLLCACSLYDYADNAETPASPADSTIKYINLSIVVSAGNEGTTRAGQPAGGENGDGREIGSGRENKVTGITLMLYRDDKGINTDDNTTIDFIRYYGVTEIEKSSDANIEVSYETGYQPLAGTDIKLDEKYHAIVVANKNLTGEVFVRSSSVADVRKKIISEIYDGGGIGIDAKNFVMASEKDFAFTLKDLTSEDKVVDGKPALVYSLDGIRIERLAARIDFWMKGAKYQTKDDNSAYETPGYEYNVTKPDGTLSDDKFVLTAVTPFNIYDESEFYIKHVHPSDGNEKYLEDETMESYVIDPKTVDKETVTLSVGLKYINPLSELVKASTVEDMATAAGDWRRTTEYLHEGKEKETENSQYATFDGIGADDNFILCYPKENALKLSSPLYYYATGVAIEGYYYKDGQGTGEYRVYYGFLRHQGEGSSSTYTINTKEDFVGKENELVGDQKTAMNFSVVRNNIYRISIDKITEQGIELKIIVKEWDKFTHDMIYM